MTRVAPYAVDFLPGVKPTEVVEITTRLETAYDAPVVVRHRTSDRVVRNRMVALTVVLGTAAMLGLNGPLWAAMPWAATP